MSHVARAINHIGHGALTKVARRCNVGVSAVQKWRDNGVLPTTDLWGQTQYAEVLEEMTAGEVTVEQLRDEIRRKWDVSPPRKRRKRVDVRAVG